MKIRFEKIRCEDIVSNYLLRINSIFKSILIENEDINHKNYQNKLRAEFQGILQKTVKHASFKYRTKKHNLEKITLISTF